jgi:hypothetical protein
MKKMSKMKFSSNVLNVEARISRNQISNNNMPHITDMSIASLVLNVKVPIFYQIAIRAYPKPSKSSSFFFLTTYILPNRNKNSAVLLRLCNQFLPYSSFSRNILQMR